MRTNPPNPQRRTRGALPRVNLPTSLTLLRIFLVPLLVVVLLTPPWALAQGIQWAGWLAPAAGWLATWREITAVVIFLVAASTDWLDGYLARRRGQVTTLGQLLDPIADKLLTASAFIALVELKYAPAWMVVVIVGREFVISGMRNIAAARGVVMSASVWGKYKTVSQVVAIALLILTKTLERLGGFQFLGVAVLWVVLLLAIVSAADYFVKFLKVVDLAERR